MQESCYIRLRSGIRATKEELRNDLEGRCGKGGRTFWRAGVAIMMTWAMKISGGRWVEGEKSLEDRIDLTCKLTCRAYYYCSDIVFGNGLLNGQKARNGGDEEGECLATACDCLESCNVSG